MTSRRPPPDDGGLRAALSRAASVQEHARRFSRKNPDGLLLPTPKAVPSPEHYHVVYTIPKEELRIPHFRITFRTTREAYQHVFDLAQQAEPNVEYYEDGQVGLEMRMRQRSGLWWVILEVAPCIAQGCQTLGGRSTESP